MRSSRLICALFVVVALLCVRAQTNPIRGTVKIDVNTGATSRTPAGAESNGDGGGGGGGGDGTGAPLDLTDVEIILGKGEDVTTVSSPSELMIRTLSALPVVEQDRIGFTALMDKSKASGEEALEADLRSLWEVRQLELEEAMAATEESADFLAALIKTLKSHVDSNRADDETVLDALNGLEDHLSDMDMARDFHDALGGWPSLTNLLLPTQSLQVRAAAALVMGTAVKNQDEFQGWILEPVALSLSTDTTSEEHMHEEAALALLTHMLVKGCTTTTTTNQNGTTTSVTLCNEPTLEESDPVGALAMRKKALYAIASGIRQNPHTQSLFLSLDGLSRLEHAADAEAEFAASDKHKKRPDHSSLWQLRLKLATMLADWITEAGSCDWVTDVGECGVEEGTAASGGRVDDVSDVAGLAAAELRSMRWCRIMAGAMDASAPQRVHEKALQALALQAPYCAAKDKGER